MNTNYTSDLPVNYYYGGGSATFATPLSISLIALAIILILSLPRKYAFVPFLLAGLLIPLNVGMEIYTLNINANRLLLVAGWIRLLIRGERYSNRLNSLDKTIVFVALVNSIAYILAWREFGAITNRAGYLITMLGMYFLLRSLIRDKEDVIRAIQVLALVVMVIAPFMWREHLSQYNAFSILGAPEYSNIRNERIRAQGPMAHAIIAGTFGAVLLPLFVGLWWYKPRAWLVPALGIISSVLMVIASSSSTPAMTLPAGILALSMWPLRQKMRNVRWAIVGTLILLQLVMKAPIWFLMTRLSGVIGGSGWHRSMLIDNFVRHFFEWWLIGTLNNPNWGWSMWDVDNAFVGAGITGGLLGFILFLSLFVYAYRWLGNARSALEESRRDARLIWAIGAALFANTVAFFGIVYFDQSIIAWYTLLVMISVVTSLDVESPPPLTQTGVAVPFVSSTVCGPIASRENM